MNFWKKFKEGSIIFCVAELLLGAIMVFMPEKMLDLIAYVVGGVLLILGISSLIGYFKNGRGLVSAIVQTAAGAVFIIGAGYIIGNIISVVFGLYFIIKGALMLFSAMGDRKYFKKGAATEAVFAAATLVFGVVLFFIPSTSRVFFIVGGIFLIVNAVTDLVNIFAVSKKVTRIKNGAPIELHDDIIDIEAKEIEE